MTRAFDSFRNRLTGPLLLEDLRAGLIGEGIAFDTIFGQQKLLYADYTASGRALVQVEDFLRDEVLPWYANTHTEASLCGMVSGRLREGARAVIARLTGAGEDCDVVFAGSGATAGLNRIVQGLDLAGRVRLGQRVVVISGPYEHHSNILPWRESGAEVVVIGEAADGGPDLPALEEALAQASGADLVIGSFSAASNVTGILTDTDLVTRRLRAAGALSVWDYAAAAPYIPVDMGRGDAAKDAIVFSAHKFPGGPGASGVLILRHGLAWRQTPAQPGGGTVRFVSPWRHDYSRSIVDREEAGTPNIPGDIRAALCLLVKEAIGQERITARETALREAAIAAWSGHERIELLGQVPGAGALPIFSFRIRDGKGGYIHHQLFARLLSDHDGIQVRSGCACAGPYAHRLLQLDQAASERLVARLDAGHEMEKPGWVRLNFSYLHSDADVQRILEAVARLADAAPELSRHYMVDETHARFRAEPDRACAG